MKKMIISGLFCLNIFCMENRLTTAKLNSETLANDDRYEADPSQLTRLLDFLTNNTARFSPNSIITRLKSRFKPDNTDQANKVEASFLEEKAPEINVKELISRESLTAEFLEQRIEEINRIKKRIIEERELEKSEQILLTLDRVITELKGILSEIKSFKETLAKTNTSDLPTKIAQLSSNKTEFLKACQANNMARAAHLERAYRGKTNSILSLELIENQKNALNSLKSIDMNYFDIARTLTGRKKEITQFTKMEDSIFIPQIDMDGENSRINYSSPLTNDFLEKITLVVKPQIRALIGQLNEIIRKFKDEQEKNEYDSTIEAYYILSLSSFESLENTCQRLIDQAMENSQILAQQLSAACSNSND